MLGVPQVYWGIVHFFRDGCALELAGMVNVKVILQLCCEVLLVKNGWPKKGSNQPTGWDRCKFIVIVGAAALGMDLHAARQLMVFTAAS